MNKHFFRMLAAAVSCSFALLSCTPSAVNPQPIGAILDGPVALDEAPAAVRNVLSAATPDERYELILSDARNDVYVWGLMQCAEDVPADGFGVLVVKEGVATPLPDIRHGRQPSARFDASTGNLWIIGGDIEGTGTQVERPYRLRFDAEGKAEVACTINPYDIQQALAQRLGFTVEGDLVTLYADGERLDTATNTIDDMGAIDEEAVWIGEQIGYHFIGNALYVDITPGLRFVNGPALAYDDLPTLTARVVAADDCSFTIEELKRYVADPFAGRFVSDYDSSELEILPREDGRYDVVVSLTRLTLLDDGVGSLADDGLHFSATDASGQPIEGTISLIGDAARLVFTKSTWGLINNGDSFEFERKY